MLRIFSRIRIFKYSPVFLFQPALLRISQRAVVWLPIAKAKAKRLGLRIFFVCSKYRKQLYAFLILSLISILQVTLFNYFRIFNVKPDLILSVLISYTFFLDFTWTVSFAFLGGVFRDLMEGLPFGYNTVLCIVWVVLSSRVSRRLSVEHVLVRNIIVCSIILMNNIVMRFILISLGNVIELGVFFRVVILECIFTLILFFSLYKLLKRFLTPNFSR